MESTLPVSNNSPEVGVPILNTLPHAPEVLPAASAEAVKEKPVSLEAGGANQLQGGPALPAPIAQQSQKHVQPAAPISKQLSDDNPVVARDEEVIEKEWVDKAKKVVAQTKSNPYLQEKEIGKLQADYLKKRYGKEVKISD